MDLKTIIFLLIFNCSIFSSNLYCDYYYKSGTGEIQYSETGSCPGPWFCTVTKQDGRVYECLMGSNIVDAQKNYQGLVKNIKKGVAISIRMQGKPFDNDDISVSQIYCKPHEQRPTDLISPLLKQKIKDWKNKVKNLLKNFERLKGNNPYANVGNVVKDYINTLEDVKQKLKTLEDIMHHIESNDMKNTTEQLEGAGRELDHSINIAQAREPSFGSAINTPPPTPKPKEPTDANLGRKKNKK